MEINGVDLMQVLSRTNETALNTSSSSVLEMGQGSQGSRSSERLEISLAGKLGSAISQMTDEEREEMRVFHKEMMDAVKNGTFDASEMAANAPDVLKSFAEENGVDLESMLEDQASMMQNMATTQGPPPPPPLLYGSDGSGKTYSSESLSTNFLEQLLKKEDTEETSMFTMNEL
jgi:hypothetical protein